MRSDDATSLRGRLVICEVAIPGYDSEFAIFDLQTGKNLHEIRFRQSVDEDVVKNVSSVTVDGIPVNIAVTVCIDSQMWGKPVVPGFSKGTLALPSSA